ncbi:MAG: zinc ribbon domain-containing protein [Tepidisphaeraceae bacterium]
MSHAPKVRARPTATVAPSTLDPFVVGSSAASRLLIDVRHTRHRATFQQVQDKFGTDFKVYHSPKLTFAGSLITCGHCGHAVTGEKKFKNSPDGTKREYSYYRCTHYAEAGHPRVRLSEKQVDEQLIAFFETLRFEDAEFREWFVDVIKAKAHAEYDQAREHQRELTRQREQISVKLQALLDLRMDGEITADEYARKRQELYERQSAIALQLQVSDRDGREIADLAVKAFELAQSLTERWIRSKYNAKRTVLGIMLKTVRLNSGNLEPTWSNWAQENRSICCGT